MFAKPRIKKSIGPPPSKKRKQFHAVEEVNFDNDARAEYLTGFRKRKLARVKQAQEIAKEKERQEKIKMRKQMRDERKKAVDDHVETVNRLLREARHAGTDDVESGEDSDDEGWEGIPDETPLPPVDLEEEYIDEDRYTTVTIEAVNVDKDGLHKPEAEPEVLSRDEGGEGKNGGEASGASERSKKEWPKKKKKKFRYETKLERQISERKRKAKAMR